HPQPRIIEHTAYLERAECRLRQVELHLEHRVPGRPLLGRHRAVGEPHTLHGKGASGAVVAAESPTLVLETVLDDRAGGGDGGAVKELHGVMMVSVHAVWKGALRSPVLLLSQWRDHAIVAPQGLTLPRYWTGTPDGLG